MKITIKNVSIKAHYLVDEVERYHNFSRRVYTIIATEIFDVDSVIALQMTFKIINDSIEPNDFVFILFVFDVFF